MPGRRRRKAFERAEYAAGNQSALGSARRSCETCGRIRNDRRATIKSARRIQKPSDKVFKSCARVRARNRIAVVNLRMERADEAAKSRSTEGETPAI